VLLTYVLFAVSLIIILIACELFSNGVEWFGHRLDLGEGAVGSILAAIGTALPETIIPILAIMLGSSSGESIGIGAIIGSSFMLATLAMFVAGTGTYVFSITRGRSRILDIHLTTLMRDLRYFLASYGLALLAALIHVRGVQLFIAIILVTIYAQYFRSTISDSGETGTDLKPLHFHKKGLPPRWRLISLQLLVSLGVIIYGAHLFIDQVITLSEHFAISTLILSLLVTPIATELPEKFNSILWIRKKKDTLAIGNISGAMVFQSCILPTVGIIATPWQLNEPAIVAALLGIAASVSLYAILKTRKQLRASYLIISGVFYFGFITYVLAVNAYGKNFITGFLTHL
jgi:cation:H+ antiporter